MLLETPTEYHSEVFLELRSWKMESFVIIVNGFSGADGGPAHVLSFGTAKVLNKRHDNKVEFF